MAKRGRPKGGTSFVSINLEQLNDLFGRKQTIPVSRVWLEKLDVVIDSVPSAVVTSSEAPTEEASKIDIKLQA